MKFKKFVKSLGADGILYVRENGDRWLSSGSIFMKVPEDIRTVTACDSASMLSLIENIINYDTFSQPCELVEAVMPVADGVIKDCVRIFATENSIDKTAICNDGYALIERGGAAAPHPGGNGAPAGGQGVSGERVPRRRGEGCLCSQPHVEQGL